MELEEVIKDIYHVAFKTQIEMCSTLVRFQEHYESPEFRGKVFTLAEFKKWYTANSLNGKKTGKFTYYTDWGGFNLPDYAFAPFRQGLFDPLSRKEAGLLKKLPDKDKFYFIGTEGEETDPYCLRHEVAHGLYYLNPEYKERANQIIKEINAADRLKVFAFLRDNGYGEAVFEDELHAYCLDADSALADKLSLNKEFLHQTEEMKMHFAKYAPSLA